MHGVETCRATHSPRDHLLLPPRAASLSATVVVALIMLGEKDTAFDIIVLERRIMAVSSSLAPAGPNATGGP